MENKSIKEFSELTASKSPVPGGGGVCANIGALAAALGEMVTNLTIGKSKYISFTLVFIFEPIEKSLIIKLCDLTLF